MNKKEEHLGKLEKLEKKFKCPLEVIYKALRQDFIYTQGIDVYGEYDETFKLNKLEGICLSYNPDFKSMVLVGFEDWFEYPAKLSDYKRTWWLREDKTK